MSATGAIPETVVLGTLPVGHKFNWRGENYTLNGCTGHIAIVTDNEGFQYRFSAYTDVIPMFE